MQVKTLALLRVLGCLCLGLWTAVAAAVGLGEAQVIDAGLMVLPPLHAGPPPDGGANVIVLHGNRRSLIFGTGQAYRDGRQILDLVRLERLPDPYMAFIPAALPGYVFGGTALQHGGVALADTGATGDLINQRCDHCLERLRASDGDEAMAGSAVPVADVALMGEIRIDLGGRMVQVMDMGWAAVPGELALFDEATGTLVTAELVVGQGLPQLRDAHLDGWLQALDRIEALAPKRIVPGRGGVLPPSAIACTRDYLVNVGKQVRDAYARGQSLSEAENELKLPGATPDEARIHSSNVQVLYLQMEKADLGADASAPLR